MEQLHDEQGHPRSPGSYSDLDNTADNTVSRRQQFHAAARLQLAAALLEYDYEQDGKLAEHSAIFAPYRQEPDLSSAAAAVPSSCTAPEHAQDGVPVQPDIDRREHGQAHELWQGEQQGQARYSVAYSNSDVILPSSAPRKSFDFLSPRSENGLAATNTLTTVASPEQALSPQGPPTLYDEPEVDEAELASEWGLDNVVNKFENLNSNAFRAEASKIKVAAAATTSSSRKGVKGRKRSGTSGSDILLDLGGMTFDANLKLSGQENGELEAEELEDPTFGIDAHSAPTVLLSKQQKKLRHRSGSMAKAVRKSLESELELAFSGSASNAEDFEGGAASQYGGRSRSSSFGAPFNGPFLTPEVAKDEAVKASADYAAEAVARPPSSLSMNGNYVSRFDPKAIAAQREEELSTRPRFPNALRPKILIMPAPLAELEAEEKARQEAEAQAELEAVTEKPRIEREAGKLYGRSLMDELQSRKERQKLRNRAFRGDSRKAMMDMQKFKRAPSPLATPGEGEGQGPPGVASPGEGEEGSDDDDKPLRPATSAPIGDDPWLKYTSHRSLANVAKGKSISGLNEITKGAVKNSPTSPALASPNKRKSLMPALDTQRHTLSTAELQHQYKQNRQSMLHLDKLRNNEDVPSGDEDDDVPLGMRQEQLASSQNQDLSPRGDEDKALLQQQQQHTRLKEAQSVFGVDLVMQKELAKLEQILEIEEAEKRIQAERQRIKDAEREAKEAKKRAKAAKKEKKKKLKEKAKAEAAGKNKKAPAVIENRDDGVDVQWQTQRGSDPPVLDLPGDEHLQEWQEHDYQRQSYYPVHAKGEMDDFFGADSNRNSLMPHETEDGILTSRPGHTRSSSLAPSLTLPFLAGDTAGTEKAAGPPGAIGWFSEDKAANGNDSDDDDEDREERVRCKSPFGIENFASDDDERMDATAIWAKDDEKEEARMREISYDPSKKPELQRMSVAASFAGVLEGFGIGGPAGGDGSDDEGDKENKRSTVQARRLSVHTYKDGSDDSNDEDDEEERRPLSSILLGNNRKSQAFSPGRTPGKVAFEPPRLDLPLDFAIATGEDSDSEAEDEAPLAMKRLNASLTAGAQGRTYDDEDDVQQGNNEDSEEDDLPLAVKQNDDKPLGQAHPVAALTQQMELQQQQNMALMTHLQLQYQYAMQMQLQQAIIQQADIQGYTASQLNYVPPAAALSGAASDIGADLGPDPKLVNSVDRWRQGVQ